MISYHFPLIAYENIFFNKVLGVSVKSSLPCSVQPALQCKSTPEPLRPNASKIHLGQNSSEQWTDSPATKASHRLLFGYQQCTGASFHLLHPTVTECDRTGEKKRPVTQAVGSKTREREREVKGNSFRLLRCTRINRRRCCACSRAYFESLRTSLSETLQQREEITKNL